MFFEPLRYSPIKHNNSLSIHARETFSATKSRWIVKKLSNITELSMWRPCFTDLDVGYILDQWTGLEKFNIGDYDLEDGIDDFWMRINRLTSLKHLGLFLTFEYVNVSQLETLCIQLICFETEKLIPLSNTLIKLGPNIRHLFLSNINTSEQEMEKSRKTLLQNDVLAKTLSNQVTHLTLQTSYSSPHRSVTLPVLNYIGDHFDSLTHLDIRLYYDLYMHDIVGPLSRLKKLTSLRLSTTIKENDEAYARLFQTNAELLGNGIQSVRKLHLASNFSTSTTPKADFYKDVLQLAFPGLTELRFERSIQMYQCVDCNSDDRIFMQSRLFNGGEQCVCSSKLWDTFSRMKLQVYRNNHLVFHHKTSTFEQFLVRLERFGQSPYRSLMFD